MVGALWTGISGLAGQQTALDNESNNIANVNTIGYKSSRISFADQMYQNKIGKGAQVLDAEKMYKQGNLKVTGVNYDIALAGDGFFAVSNTRGGGTSETYYTRAGNFRMGDSGTLQDALGNDVQGWAMSNEPTVESSNPNIDIFTNDYTKMLSSKIISYSSAVETITAKATDFTLTAKDDNKDVFTGAGLKTKAGKINDVEELVKAYTKKLQALKDDPNSSSASAKSQISHIDLENSGSSYAASADGDEVYVNIDGNRISQPYLSGTADPSAVPPVTAAEDGYRKTMKAFADMISKEAGLKAYVADSSYNPSTTDANVNLGILRIESIVPGEIFTISSCGTVHASTDKPGISSIDVVANAGKGLGALESVRNALNKAVTGKQMDVYTTSDLPLAATDEFTYQIIVYDKGQEKNVTVPEPALPITATTGTVDEIVTAINGDPDLQKYIQATNINGSLVVKTLDSNFDVEFTGDLKNTVRNVTAGAASLTGGDTDTFDNANPPIPNGYDSFTITAGGNSVTITKPADMDELVSAINADANFGSSGSGVVTASKNASGQLVLTHNTGGTDPASSFTVVATGDVKRSADYSGREGAGAEFMEIKTRIDQAASKGSMQLRLDSLKISDSAFGDFEVDETGLITMSQDGAMFAVGQVAIAKFITNRGLEPIGNNLLKVTLESGDPIYNLNNDKTAEIKSNTLELSTADLSESLVNLMVFQRAFEANAKSITTADTILNTLIQLKR